MTDTLDALLAELLAEPIITPYVTDDGHIDYTTEGTTHE